MRLGVNIDHVATLRQARLGKEPDLIRAATIAELAGADGITIHLREDRRHIQDKDVRILREVVTTSLNLEMATSDDIVELAMSIKPDNITLVPEKRQELTTEGGLNLFEETVVSKIRTTIKRLHNVKIPVTLFIDPHPDLMKIARELEADSVELHTGTFANAKTKKMQKEELDKIKDTMKAARALKLKVKAGHGLDYKNILPLVCLKEIEEVNIGHSIIAKSIFLGLFEAVKQMKELIRD